MAFERSMTARDVAYTLQISVKQVYRMAKAGELPGFRAGGRWRFHPEQIRQWMLERSRVGNGWENKAA